MAWTPYYKPHFQRHLHNLVINGFYARSLDADDHAFLESVKVKGIANGSLPSSSAALIEELDFWHFPYAVAPGIERRVGKKPPVEETPEQRELRKARSSRWRAQREIRKQERAIAAIELERERRRHAEENRRRAVREVISDAEWNAAAPKQAPFGAIIDGVYHPEWKLQEMGIVPEDRPLVPPRRVSRKEVQETIDQRELEREAAARKAKRDAEIRQRLIETERLAEEARKRWSLQKSVERARQRKEEAEKRRREKVLEEARDNLIRIALMERQWNGLPKPDHLVKEAILTLLNRSPGQTWNGPDVARAIGCTDVYQMNRCLDELVRSGRLKTGTPP